MLSITKVQICLFICIMMFIAGAVYAQSDEEGEGDVTTELVIEDFTITGLGDSGSFGIGIGGLFEGSSMLDMHFDFFINPLVAIRLSADIVIPFIPVNNTTVIALDVGMGAIWRSYVVNRVRFYGGLLLRGGTEPLNDFDILLIPEGFGGFEFYASPTTSIYAEFGGRTAITIVSLSGDPKGQGQSYAYADGFFFKMGTRFGL